MDLAAVFNSLIVNKLQVILEIQLFPYFSLGNLISVLLVVAFLIVIIKRFMI